jgi:hypothetical protein
VAAGAPGRRILRGRLVLAVEDAGEDHGAGEQHGGQDGAIAAF